ncbi:fructose-6-phosphate aldolase [Rossellomorea sp. H39__3]
MRLVIDSADTKWIKKIVECFPIDGVTTNPSIVVKEKKPFLPLLREIRSLIGDDKDLFVQTISTDAKGIIQEAESIVNAISGKVVVKIPVTMEGIKAIKHLHSLGIRTLATTVYTPMNAFLAAKAGADFVAPYVNRIDNLSGNGVKVVEEIEAIFRKHELNCEILAASFKNVQQIQQVCLAGAHGVTAAPDLIESFIKIPSISSNVEDFKRDWVSLYGEEHFTIEVE